MCAALFMQLGLDLKAHIVPRQQQRHLALGIAVILFAFTLLAPINGGVGLGGPTVNNPVWFIALATAGSLASVGLVIWLQPFARLSKWLQTLGHHSMGILVLHMLAIKGVKVVLSVVTGTSITLMEQHLGWGLLVLVSSVLIMWPAIAFINHFAPWILGHKPVSQSLHQT
jgi:fucose 4-O-acetylase-like acetyltransferase